MDFGGLHICDCTECYLKSRLDYAYERLRNEDVQHALSELARALDHVRATLPPAEWGRSVRDIIRVHPLSRAILASPLARRSRLKSRAACSDAILLDMIYGLPEFPGRDAQGDAICEFERSLPTIAAFREAYLWIRDELGRLAATRPNARVLAIGSGHCREIDAAALAHFGSNARFVAADGDPNAVAAIRRRLVDPRVRAVCEDPLVLAARSRKAGHLFDVIYRITPATAGKDHPYVALAAALLPVLRPGGKLLIAVPSRDRPDAAYLEALWDWQLRDSSAHELSALLAPSKGTVRRITFKDLRGPLLRVQVTPTDGLTAG